MNESHGGEGVVRKDTIEMQCGKSYSRDQDGRCREQREEASTVWLGTGSSVEEVASADSEGPGGGPGRSGKRFYTQGATGEKAQG